MAHPHISLLSLSLSFPLWLTLSFFLILALYTFYLAHTLVLRFLGTQGMNMGGLTARDLEYGSKAFKSVTKLKSQVRFRHGFLAGEIPAQHLATPLFSHNVLRIPPTNASGY